MNVYVCKLYCMHACVHVCMYVCLYVNRGDWGSVLVCLKPKSVVASHKFVGVKNLFFCVK